jgi:hypothetical protein
MPPPVACSVWWYSYHYGVAVPTPDGWGHITEADGVMCGRIALAGWVLVLLAIWWDGYVAYKLGLDTQRATTVGSKGAATDADAAGGREGLQRAGSKKLHVRSKKAL